MRKRDIKTLVETYGVNNIRIFYTDEQTNQGFFRNPLAGRKEYKITERRDKIADNYKISMKLVDAVFDTPEYASAPDWWKAAMDERRMYITDFDRCSHVEVFALVDEDSKYERIG